MKNYLVIVPWVGVAAGTVIQREKLHPALKAHVRPYDPEAEKAALKVATPAAAKPAKASESQDKGPKPLSEGQRKGVIAKALKEAGIKFDGKLSADELGELLPPEKLAELFPTA